MKIVGNKMYEVCPCCGKIVQLNKFLFGAIHICAISEDYNQPGMKEALQQRYEYNKKMLDEA